MLIDPARSQLLVVDVQEKLLPIVTDPERLLRNVRILLDAGRLTGMPATFSEQYPRGLGPTVAELSRDIADADRPIAKTEFSCARSAEFSARLDAAGRDQVIVCGIEAHVCVLQTAMDLRERGREVFVVADAVDSRAEHSRETALRRMAAAGVFVVTTEMVVFEQLGSADNPAFREASRLIR
jgi:nicotinamidase-related amidase